MSAFSSGVTAFGGQRNLRQKNPLGSFDPAQSPGGLGSGQPHQPGSFTTTPKPQSPYPGLRRRAGIGVQGGLPPQTPGPSNAGQPVLMGGGTIGMPGAAPPPPPMTPQPTPPAYNMGSNSGLQMPMVSTMSAGAASIVNSNRPTYGPGGQLQGSSLLDLYRRTQNRVNPFGRPVQ